jgi:hypothetical protein
MHAKIRLQSQVRHGIYKCISSKIDHLRTAASADSKWKVTADAAAATAGNEMMPPALLFSFQEAWSRESHLKQSHDQTL